MSTHVLDTCALLDLAAGRWKFAPAREALVAAGDPVVLAVSVWEIARKLRIGKLQLPCRQDEVHAFANEVCVRYRVRLIPLTSEHCEGAELLPPFHQDPFDRMILSCARMNGAPVFTIDPQFRAYPVEVIAYR